MNVIKPVLKYQPPVNPTQFKDAKCLLTISVGQEVHEGDKFEATIDLVNASFGRCILLIDDSLQRHSMALNDSKDAEDFYTPSIVAGDAWLERNQRYYERLTHLESIVRWDRWLEHPDYAHHRTQLKWLLNEDPTYQAAFEHTIEAFLRRYAPRLPTPEHLDGKRARKLCFDYLLEECTALCLWSELGCQVEVYPGKRNLAMEETHKRFVVPHQGDILHPVWIKFKNRKPLTPQTFLTGSEVHERNESRMPKYTPPNIATDERARIEQLETVVALTPGHVYWLGLDGRYLGCNDLQAQSAGLVCRQDIIGKTNQDLPWNQHPHLEPAALDAMNQQVMQTGKTLTAEEPAIMPDGTEKLFFSTKAPLRNSQGKIIGMVGISIDITERKTMERIVLDKLETVRVLTRAKSEFLDRLHHDIRTPMKSMGELADMLSKCSITPVPKQLANMIKSSSQSLLKFFDAVLEAIHIGSGNLTGVHQPFNLHETLESVLEIVNPTARIQNTTLQYHCDDNVPEFLMGDPIRLSRVLLELLLNGAKFTEKGCVQALIRIESMRDNKLVLHFTIEDTGIGIPPNRHAEIFTRFSKFATGQGSCQNLCNGAGMGLFIVKRFIEEMGGAIHCDRKYTTGTRFIFLLPMSYA